MDEGKWGGQSKGGGRVLRRKVGSRFLAESLMSGFERVQFSKSTMAIKWTIEKQVKIGDGRTS